MVVRPRTTPPTTRRYVSVSDLNPISIEFAETGNEIGLLENNVGDTVGREQRHLERLTAGVAVSGLSVSTSGASIRRWMF